MAPIKIIQNLSPASRLALGLVSLTFSLILLTDIFTGLISNRFDNARKVNLAKAQLIAISVATTLQKQDLDNVEPLISSIVAREHKLKYIAVRGVHHVLLAQAGDRSLADKLSANENSPRPSTPYHFHLPLLQDSIPWGEVELVFSSEWPVGINGWLHEPLAQSAVLIFILGFVVYRLYLRRMLRYLDPKSAVPEHVRTAFDTLSEGVLVLDQQGCIMLANRAFKNLQPDELDRYTGRPAADLDWLCASFSGLPDQLPWMLAIKQNLSQLGRSMQVEVPLGGRRELILNCSPITDGFGQVRGCLASFADVTELHEQTEQLRVTNQELAASQLEIRQKNEELLRLATRDALTGCYNRRALMSETERCLAEAAQSGAPLCCIMGDIDHFKSINDRFGHGVGDVAIQSVARAMERGLRSGDILGRYGGEEFCMILPNTSLKQALEIAERLRMEIETTAGPGVRDPADLRITSSLGVSQFESTMKTPSALIDQADQALYLSKQTGRNRVSSWAQVQAQSKTAAMPAKTAAG